MLKCHILIPKRNVTYEGLKIISKRVILQKKEITRYGKEEISINHERIKQV